MRTDLSIRSDRFGLLSSDKNSPNPMDEFQRKASKTVGMRRKETDRIRLQRIVGFSTHPTRSDAPDFTWDEEENL